MKKCWLNKIEIALLLSLCLSLCAGAWVENESEKLSSGLVRLHVLAVSDDAAEQELKLRVRDSVLSYLSPKLDDTKNAEEALAVIEGAMDGIKSAAEEAAAGRSVTVTLGREYYPTREYGVFALPAGTYTSLRVVLGGGEGQNWWCVVFPPLCLTAAEAADVMERLPDGGDALLAGDDGGYVLKFRLLELWGELKSKLGG
jgi:stage II sporulation protein R